MRKRFLEEAMFELRSRARWCGTGACCGEWVGHGAGSLQKVRTSCHSNRTDESGGGGVVV